MADEGGERATSGEETSDYGERIRTDGDEDALSTAFDLLSTPRRRYALYYLRDNEGAELDELTRSVAGAIDDSEAGVSDEQFEETKIGLRHSDLPRLREAGVVEYDRRTDQVRYRDSPRSLSVLLRVCSELESTPTSRD